MQEQGQGQGQGQGRTHSLLDLLVVLHVLLSLHCLPASRRSFKCTLDATTLDVQKEQFRDANGRAEGAIRDAGQGQGPENEDVCADGLSLATVLGNLLTPRRPPRTDRDAREG